MRVGTTGLFDKFAQISPSAICSSYIIFMALAFVQEFYDVNSESILFQLMLIVLMTAFLFLTLGWPTSVVYHLESIGRNHGTQPVTVFRLLVLTILFIMSPVLIEVIAQDDTLLESNLITQIITMIVVMIGYGAALRILWVVARALVSAEENAKPRSDRVIGTFLQLLVLPVGVFAISRRLDELFFLER